MPSIYGQWSQHRGAWEEVSRWSLQQRPHLWSLPDPKSRGENRLFGADLGLGGRAADTQAGTPGGSREANWRFQKGQESMWLSRWRALSGTLKEGQKGTGVTWPQQDADEGKAATEQMALSTVGKRRGNLGQERAKRSHQSREHWKPHRGWDVQRGRQAQSVKSRKSCKEFKPSAERNKKDTKFKGCSENLSTQR